MTLESPLDSKEIKTINPKGNQSWIFIGRTDAEVEAPILWPPAVKSQLTGKDPDAGKDWTQEEKGPKEDEMVGWHHWLNGHEFEQAPGVGDGQLVMVCWSPWDHKDSDTIEWLNWTEALEEPSESESHSVMSDSLQPHALYSLWNSPGQNTGVGSLSLLQGIFPIQGSNLGLLHCRQILYQLSHKGSPRILEWMAYPFSSGSSWPRNRTRVSSIAGRFLTNWAIREAPYRLPQNWFKARKKTEIWSPTFLTTVLQWYLTASLS